MNLTQTSCEVPANNLSQPAASRRISALEASLNVKLFDRIGRRFRLTAEGKSLLKHSRQLVMAADALATEAQTLTEPKQDCCAWAPPQLIERVLPASPGLPLNAVAQNAHDTGGYRAAPNG